MVDRDNPLQSDQSDPVTSPSAAPSVDGRHLSTILDSTLMLSVSSAGPSESCARAAGTDDGDLSEPILACVCVRVGGDRGEWGGTGDGSDSPPPSSD